MSASFNSRPTFADLQNAIASSQAIPAERRRRMENAINSIWRWTGITPDNIPANMPALRTIVDGIQPAAHGVKRQTVHNARNLVMQAMKKSGLTPELASYGEKRKGFSPQWAVIVERLQSYQEKNSLWSMLRFFDEQGFKPHLITDSEFEAFARWADKTSFRANQHTALRNCGLHWNRLRERCPDLKLQGLTPPASKLRRLPYALTDFPVTFQAHVAEWQEWLTGKDIFHPNARMRSVSANTAGGYLRKVHRAACICADYLGSPLDVVDLSTLVTPKNYKQILSRLRSIENSEQHTESFQTSVLFLQMGRDWLQLDSDWFAELSKVHKKLPRPKMEMTTKNKMLVAQFDDPATLRRLFNAPFEIWKRLKKERRLSGRSRLALAQAALGLIILIHMPLRLNNLTSLAFGRDIILHRDGTSSLIIPAGATKAGRAIEFDIPASVAALLIEYHDDIASDILGKNPEWLFCRTDGDVKGFAQVRTLLQTYFKEYVGFHMNPHAFRHLCAKLILDANPGAHTLVQELLGHKSIETSTAFYAGLNSRRAGRHHSQLIAETLAREAPTHNRRRRRWKED